jgi:phenylacetate-CoA ligase
MGTLREQAGPGVPENYWRFCANARIRLKDRVAHPYCAAIWPECVRVEGMSRDELAALQRQRLADLLSDVTAHVPFYRRWAGQRPELTDLPIMTKETIRQQPEAFLSDRFDAKTLVSSKTSGSSGEPFAFRQHRRALDYSYACLWRALGRHGLRPGQRRVYLWGRSHVFNPDERAVRRMSRRNRVRDWLNNTLMIDAYELSDGNVDQAIARIEAFAPVYLHGYVSALYTVARRMLAQGRTLAHLHLRAAVTESEKLYDFQREALGQALACPILENYGSVEMGNIAEMDVQGRLRPNEDLYVIETLAGGAAVLTHLMSHAHPFIRFKLGDLLEFAADVPGPLPYRVINQVIGRTLDLFPRPDGGYVHGMAMAHVLDPHLRYIRRYQLRQEQIERFRIKLELAEPLPQEASRRITDDLRRLMGAPVAVEIEAVQEIAPAASGKFRWVISDVSDVAQRAMSEERVLLDALDGRNQP